jgi:hypothetical protein
MKIKKMFKTGLLLKVAAAIVLGNYAGEWIVRIFNPDSGAVRPYFALEIEPVFGVMTALLPAFVTDVGPALRDFLLHFINFTYLKLLK